MSQDEKSEQVMSEVRAFQDCVIAEYRSMEHAELAIQVLGTGGFTDENVSTVSYNQPGSGDRPALEKTSANNKASEIDSEERSIRAKLEGSLPEQVRGNPDPQKADRAAGAGALIGGAIATPLSISTLVGPFFVAGPLLGIGLGAAVGGLFGVVERWGVRKDLAADYEQRVREGSVLLIVTDSELRLHEAYKLLQTTGPFTIERFRVPA